MSKRVWAPILAAVLIFGCVHTAPEAERTSAPLDTLSTASLAEAGAEAPPAGSEVTYLTICSFNIQFLGHFKDRENAALAQLVKGYDLVVVQELVAPPAVGTYPDGQAYNADPEAAAFFEEMGQRGFEWWLSEEDTGTGDSAHASGPSTEWWVAFYKPDMVERSDDLPSGFLAEDRSNNPDYERVPYAFAFRTADQKVDFVLISVHLQPGDSAADAARRRHELASIAAWVDDNDEAEKDFVILGDMNIEDADELAEVTPAGFISLNDECRQTNTNQRPGAGRPYDHVMYQPAETGPEIDEDFDLLVIDLIDKMCDGWTGDEPYPGDPYDHDEFRTHYSDHDPVVFQIAY